MELLNGADMGFVIISAALVMLMVPGLALFYGGMVKSKNVLSITVHSYAALVIISLQWIFIGYTLAFGPDVKGVIGGLDWSFLKGIGMAPNADYAGTIPHLEFVVFQLMFSAITAAVISGSVAERMNFPAFIILIILWSTFVYDPISHWVWGANGWLRNLGVLDFAGGNPVEINSGVSGLVAAIVVGKRKRAIPEPHHIPMAILGGGLLWFGWFGFNAGSALAMNYVAVNAFFTTNTSAAAGAVAWVLCEWLLYKKPTALGTVSGAIAGLVAITQGAGFVSPISAVLIGAVGGALSFFAIAILKRKLGYDDALDAFGCHGVAGIWGSIATAIFASKAINPAGSDGLIYGNFALLKAHLISTCATALYAAVATFVILKVMSLVMGLRATSEQEAEGLDISLHGEEAYSGLNM
ncbi:MULTISPECIES: ammonium transporter [Clostridium]|jgi:Amt family ammonium transporter|uniref:Ammonium transporter n=4 Tax=Clostridium TaxID=1485 RepID=A0A1S8PA74_CLOBE|nr:MULTISPECIES: ammonium transporter [Clostridium]ALB47814.1 ammonium transporter [Clostridium beijerinckii NRRL B-598]AVK49916.1 ammonia channel protein [Clostridium sp. MF28]MBC2459221.1 ammonium transporter [Clostridium beijerinckii]MBC2476721.1 ammonium transporter [Clostridium beijerinckii]MBN7573887.1 ammonium transporter [Clostridium beijerinckii]